MIALVDTNVILDYLMMRGDFFPVALELMTKRANRDFQGYVAFHSIPNIWYILRKTPEEQRREMLADVCQMLRVVAISHEEVVQMIQRKEFKDFEDCLQAGCAAHIGADYIVTRNVEDFAISEVPAILPEDFLKRLNNQK